MSQNPTIAITRSVQCLKDVETHLDEAMTMAVDLAEEMLTRDKEMGDESMCQLKRLLQSYIEMDNDVKCFISAVDEVKGKLCTEDAGVTKNYGDLLDETCSRIKVPADVTSHVQYKEFLRTIADSQGDGECVPETQEESQRDDEDLVLTQQSTLQLDPITRLELTDPVRNKYCKHVYERSSIMQYIANTRSNICRCPVSGCFSKSLTADCIEDYPELRRHLRRNKIPTLSQS